MADEITFNAGLQVSNGYMEAKRSLSRFTADQAAIGSIEGVQIVGTTYEAISLGDISTSGYCYIRNLDTTNFAEIGLDVGSTFYPFAKLLPGECVLFRVGGVLYAKADTASVKIDKLILEA